MSMGSIGSIYGPNQNAMAMLAQVNATQSTASSATDSDGDFDVSVGISPSSVTAVPRNALTGGSKASMSDQVLALLTQLQQQADSQSTAQSNISPSSTSISTLIATASTAAGSIPNTTPAGSSTNPLSQLFAAMDSNGDGSISQSEMESYIQKQGGTVAEADALFSGLNQGSTGNLTQTQLASDLKQANATGGHHHHHYHGMPTADQVGNDLVKAMDTSDSGAVDQSEFQQFVTGLGGTTAQASADFAALDPNNTGSVTAAQFSTAVQAFESAGSSASTLNNGTSPILTLLNGFAQNTTTAGSTASLTA